MGCAHCLRRGGLRGERVRPRAPTGSVQARPAAPGPALRLPPPLTASPVPTSPKLRRHSGTTGDRQAHAPLSKGPVSQGAARAWDGVHALLSGWGRLAVAPLPFPGQNGAPWLFF